MTMHLKASWNNINSQSFPDKIINIEPKKLHHQHQQRNEKGGNKWTDEGLDDKLI